MPQGETTGERREEGGERRENKKTKKKKKKKKTKGKKQGAKNEEEQKAKGKKQSAKSKNSNKRYCFSSDSSLRHSHLEIDLSPSSPSISHRQTSRLKAHPLILYVTGNPETLFSAFLLLLRKYVPGKEVCDASCLPFWWHRSRTVSYHPAPSDPPIAYCRVASNPA
ncbi:hypothetical protein EYC84_005855 [Monilinia fructicola]|uniref:Uncharacterized protein n=1 Tax=Monilinia fructicola TaxID=38448 RepID=A0A5M9K2M6_MONFR|nr:hypothetical protein EYC84_005855 [Monilinia fructicola]